MTDSQSGDSRENKLGMLDTETSMEVEAVSAGIDLAEFRQLDNFEQRKTLEAARHEAHQASSTYVPTYEREGVNPSIAEAESREDLEAAATDAGIARSTYGPDWSPDARADRKAKYLGWETDRLDVDANGQRLSEAKIVENVEAAMATAETEEQRLDVLRRAGLTANYT